MMSPVEVERSKTQHLGTLKELSSKTESANWFNDVLNSRYRMHDAVKNLLPGWGVDYCMEAVIPGMSLEVWKDTESEHAHLKGVARCGSVWTCPVCAPKIAIERREELRIGLKAAEKLGYRVIMVTLTGSHTREMTAAELSERMTTAKRWMRRHGSFRKIKELLGYKGSVSAMEVTWGFANGWHFHFHEVFFVSKVLDAGEVKKAFFTLWEKALERVGLECSWEHGVDVMIPLPGDHAAVGQYIAKWGLESELSGGAVKEGKNGNLSPFQLLALYAEDEGEYGWAGGLFQEYAKATKGKTSMRWSRGLRKLLGLGQELTDREAAEAQASENSYLLLKLTKVEYKRIIYSGRRGVIGELLAVAGCGRDALLLWLESVFDIHPEVRT